MNLKAGELKPGMLVLRGTVATPDAWVALADPPVEYVGGSGSWVRLLYVDGSRSVPMPPSYLIEIRKGEA